MMDAARWEQIQALFHRALERPAADRPAFLDVESGGDGSLADEVAALLREDARSDSLLDRGVGDVANAVIGGRGGDPPANVGPYRIIRLLGEGGMGVVYLARRDDLDSLAAIKLLRDAWLSPARRERFASEQRTLAQLHHPAIAQLYDADTLADGTPWFVMEYVEGQSLTTFCRERHAALEERLRLFRAVCEAVQHAHLHAVIHRDLKPSNILVTGDGSIKLLDFGIAKQLESIDRPAEQTRTGVRLLTPAYASPEQLLAAPVGIQTDVYSLGVILYELLSGRLPYDLSACTPGEAVTTVLERTPERPSMAAAGSGTSGLPSIRKSAWADLDVLCLTAMHRDVERRYRSAEALIRDIDHYLAGEPLEARADTVGYRTRKFVRRHWKGVAAASITAIGVFGLVTFYTIRLARARNAAVVEAARTQRIQRFMINLFQGGDDVVAPSDSLRVVTLLDRGVQQARALDREPAVQAELAQTLGALYGKLGKLDRADSLLGAALVAQRAVSGPESPAVADNLVALGLLRIDQARFDDAERLVRQAAAIDRRALPANDPAVARADAALGRVLEERGNYAAAIPLLDGAVQAMTAHDSLSPDLATALTDLANTQFLAGHYPAADSIDHRVLMLDRLLYGDHHPLVATALTNLGDIQFNLGHYPESEPFYRQALGITQAWYGPDHHETASALTALGRALEFENHFPAAVALLQQSLAIQERVYGPVHPHVAAALNELGGVALQQNHDAEAEAYFKRMVDIYRQVYHGKHYLIGIAESNLASVYMAEERYADAEPLYRDALAIYATTLAPDHTNIGITRIKLGRTLLRERRFTQAERETLAGYQLLSKSMNPGVSFLQAARSDLAKTYDSLGMHDKATLFRAEHDRIAAADSTAAKH
ncbi:MAG TPA: serine/threonine-protein kinase [Gemmatimonadales bacterium]|jgi:serine/threonine-protein kinase